jgi:hypothetical protein
MIDENNWLIEKWISHLISAEGGYVNNPHDKGGETNLGITIQTFNNAKKFNFVMPKLTNIKELTRLQAIQIYKRLYFRPTINMLNKLNFKYTPSAIIHLLDVSVNSGQKKANQMAILCGYKDKTVNNEEMTLNRKVWYSQIVNNNPSQKVFLKGWMNRIINLNKWLKENGQSA